MDTAQAVLDVGGPFGPTERVLPRAQSSYHRFDLCQLPQSRRREALELAVRRAGLIPGAPYACRWQDGVAHVWIPVERYGLVDDGVLVAETSLLPPAPLDAARLIGLREGVEGQVWSEGRLVGSRWWSSQPPLADWHRFLRSSGRAAEGGVPHVDVLPLMPAPWGVAHARSPWSSAQLESAGWHAVGAFIAFIIGWQVAAMATWSIALTLQSQRVESLRTDSAPLIDAREQAESAQQRLALLGALVEGPSDLALLAEVRRRLDVRIRVTGWSRDGGRLRIDVRGAGDDPRPVVQAFAGHPLLSAVVANPLGDGRMQLDIDLDANSAGAAP